jgi:hypothetical protein
MRHELPSLISGPHHAVSRLPQATNRSLGLIRAGPPLAASADKGARDTSMDRHFAIGIGIAALALTTAGCAAAPLEGASDHASTGAGTLQVGAEGARGTWKRIARRRSGGREIERIKAGARPTTRSGDGHQAAIEDRRCAGRSCFRLHGAIVIGKGKSQFYPQDLESNRPPTRRKSGRSPDKVPRFELSGDALTSRFSTRRRSRRRDDGTGGTREVTGRAVRKRARVGACAAWRFRGRRRRQDRRGLLVSGDHLGGGVTTPEGASCISDRSRARSRSNGRKSSDRSVTSSVVTSDGPRFLDLGRARRGHLGWRWRRSTARRCRGDRSFRSASFWKARRRLSAGFNYKVERRGAGEP